MSGTSEIRRHIRAVENTRQLTNAMYLLSTARMKKAIQRVNYTGEYYRRVRATVKDILAKSSGVHHPYLEHRPGNRAAFLVVAGDKGMCGGYNNTVLNFAWQQMQLFERRYLATIGVMATRYFKQKGITPDIELLGVAHNPTLYDARSIVTSLFAEYDMNLMDEIYVIYTRFVNSAVQYPLCVRLLPLQLDDYSDVELEYSYDADMLYVPSPQEMFDTLVPQYAVGLVYGALVNAVASEHCARMNAMQSATGNAEEMLKQLKKQYNAARQLAITQEILELSGGATEGWL